MRTLLGWVAAAAALFAAEDLEVRKPRTTPADIAAGAKTFRSHCSPCHGLHGEGGRGPNLASGRFYHGSSDADLLRNISNGVTGTEMPALFYSPDRVWQVVAYIRSLHATTPAPAGDLASGAALFRTKGCAGCHRIQGAGGRLGPDLTAIGELRSADYLRQSIVDPNADVRPRFWVVHGRDGGGQSFEGFLLNEDTYSVQFLDFHEQLRSVEKEGLAEYRIDKESRMPSFRDQLTPAELRDLVAYLSSQRTRRESK